MLSCRHLCVSVIKAIDFFFSFNDHHHHHHHHWRQMNKQEVKEYVPAGISMSSFCLLMRWRTHLIRLFELKCILLFLTSMFMRRDKHSAVRSDWTTRVETYWLPVRESSVRWITSWKREKERETAVRCICTSICFSLVLFLDQIIPSNLFLLRCRVCPSLSAQNEYERADEIIYQDSNNLA